MDVGLYVGIDMPFRAGVDDVDTAYYSIRGATGEQGGQTITQTTALPHRRSEVQAAKSQPPAYECRRNRLKAEAGTPHSTLLFARMRSSAS